MCALGSCAASHDMRCVCWAAVWVYCRCYTPSSHHSCMHVCMPPMLCMYATCSCQLFWIIHALPRSCSGNALMSIIHAPILLWQCPHAGHSCTYPALAMPSCRSFMHLSCSGNARHQGAHRDRGLSSQMATIMMLNRIMIRHAANGARAQCWATDARWRWILDGVCVCWKGYMRSHV